MDLNLKFLKLSFLEKQTKKRDRNCWLGSIFDPTDSEKHLLILKLLFSEQQSFSLNHNLFFFSVIAKLQMGDQLLFKKSFRLFENNSQTFFFVFFVQKKIRLTFFEGEQFTVGQTLFMVYMTQKTKRSDICFS